MGSTNHQIFTIARTVRISLGMELASESVAKETLLDCSNYSDEHCNMVDGISREESLVH